MTWVEKQFSKKKEKKAADEIRDMLLQMTTHVEHVQKRIAQYGELARDVRRLCEGHAAGSAAAQASQSLRSTLDRLDEAVGAVSGAAQPVDQIRKLAGEVAAQIGQQNAAAECRRLGLEIRRLGASQDRTLANCRMAARWIRQQAATWPVQSPDTAGLAEKIPARIEQMLGSK
jgi:DNA repair exonuclease SbcCD ATPase subunit